MLSGPQDLLHLILSRTDWIYETRAGWKEKFSLKSRDEIEEMLGWVENSSRLSFRAGWSKTGVEKNELKKFEGSLMTLPSSMRWISSKETSLLAEGDRGFRFFQKLLGVLALEAESAQNRLIATRFSLVTMFLCVLQCSHASLVGRRRYSLYSLFLKRIDFFISILIQGSWLDRTLFFIQGACFSTMTLNSLDQWAQFSSTKSCFEFQFKKKVRISKGNFRLQSLFIKCKSHQKAFVFRLAFSRDFKY